MEKKKLLIVTHEMDPYLVISSAAELIHALPKPVQEQDIDIRILMPRFGTINERRHRLHEVVRLSGINIVVDNHDYPLIIKVASLPSAKLQVYFLDNEEFFSRKSIFTDKEDNIHEDNAERMVFFAQGVLETVKKFGWAPDIIHVNGWFSSLIPLFLKKVYHEEPVFAKSKVIMSYYEKDFAGDLGDSFQEKIMIHSMLQSKDTQVYNQGDFSSLMQGSINYADAATIATDVDCKYTGEEKEHFIEGVELTPETFIELYQQLMN